MFCKHEWEVISEIKTQSVIEYARELELTARNIRAYDLERKLIQIVTCKKCGNLKRFVETI